MKYYSSDEPAWGFLGDECQSQYCDLARGLERHFRTRKRADSLDTTPFRLPVLPFSPTSSGRHFAGFPVAIKTPGICVNFALINEIMLFGIISELISRITWSLPLVYSVYFGKIYRFIYAEFPKGNIIVGKRRIQDFRTQYTCNWARLKTRRAALWYISLILYENSKNGTLLILSWINSSIN